MTGPYRVDDHNARHVYRGDQEIAVAFTEDDGRLIADALNAMDRALVDSDGHCNGSTCDGHCSGNWVDPGCSWHGTGPRHGAVI